MGRRVALAAVVAAAAAVLAGGCGSVGHQENVSQGEGEELFRNGCAQCHTLEAVGAQGQIGPNLDAHFAELREQGFDESSLRDLVRAQIEQRIEALRTFMEQTGGAGTGDGSGGG